MTEQTAGHDVQRSMGAVVGHGQGPKVWRVPTLVLNGLSERWASRTLSTRFLAASFAVLCATMLLAGLLMEARIKSSLVETAAHASAHVIESVIDARIQELAHGSTLSPATVSRLQELVENSASQHRILRIKIWLPDGKLAYSSDNSGVGQAHELTEGLRQAIGGKLWSEFDGRHELQSAPVSKHVVPVFEIYVPVLQTGTTRVIAVAELYEDATRLRDQIVSARRGGQIVVGAITLGMLALLFSIVQGGSSIILEQKAALELKIDEQTDLLKQNEELRGRVTRALYESAALSDKLMRRVGADLHDGPAQLLGLALLRLHELSPGSPGASSAHAEPVAAVRNHLEEAMSEIRGISSGLSLPELHAMSLEDVLRLAISTHERRTKTRVQTQLGRLPDTVTAAAKTCLYRCVQEGLTNAFRHAGGKGQTVTADVVDETMRVAIRDAGPGFTGTALRQGNDALGLVGIRHRVELLGGHLEVRSHPGKGTQLTVTLPLAGTK